MENQKNPGSSESTPPAKPVNPTTPTSNAASAEATTASKSSGLIKASSAPSPVAPTEPFRDECIVLILSPRNSVHPVVHPTNANQVRLFENPESAAAEVLGSKTLSKYRFTVIPLKGMF